MKNKYLILVRREFWEHRALWIAPLAVSLLIVLGTIFLGPNEGGPVRFGPRGMSAPPAGVNVGAMALVGMAVFLAMVAALAISSYLLESLFAERKDRSILFWKSLPVSDTETVLSKVFVALVVMPIGMLLLVMLLQPILALIMYVRFEDLRPFIETGMFQGWPQALGRLAVAWVFSIIWYAPVVGYLLLASVLAARVPLMYAVLPPVVLSLWERWMLDTNHVARFVGDRLFPWPSVTGDLLQRGGDVLAPFQTLDLWVGLAVGAGILYTVIRLRRYRDDT